MNNIDPEVYRSARGTGVAAFVAFLQIALAGYGVYAIRFSLRNDPAAIILPQSTWSMFFPLWLGIVAAFRSDKLTTIISTVVLVLCAIAIGVLGFVVLSGVPSANYRFYTINIVAIGAAILTAEIPRAWLNRGIGVTGGSFSPRAVASFGVLITGVIIYFATPGTLALRFILGFLAIFAAVAMLRLRFVKNSVIQPPSLHAAVAAAALLALIAAYQSYPQKP